MSKHLKQTQKLPGLALIFYKNDECYVILYDKNQGQMNVEKVARQNFFLDATIVCQFMKSKEGLTLAKYKYIYQPADHKIHFLPTLQKYIL